MAHTTNIVVNGTSYPVIEFDHTAQEIDDSVEKTVTMVRPNLLDNWYFAGGGSQQGGGQFPINQRGQTSYSYNSNGAYFIDRWAFLDKNSSVTLNSDNITLFNSSTATGGKIAVSQSIESSRLEKNVPYVFSVLVDEISQGSNWFISTNMGAPINAAVTQPGLVSQQFIFTAQNDKIMIYIWKSSSNSNDNIKIKAVKLEPGYLSTLARKDESGNWVLNDPPPNFQQELAKCQRYAISLNPYKYGSRTVGSGISTSTTSCYVFCPTPVPVRTTPSIKRSGSWRLVGSNTCTVSNITVNSFAGNGVKLLVTSSGLIDGETYFLESSANSSDILLSADL